MQPWAYGVLGTSTYEDVDDDSITEVFSTLGGRQSAVLELSAEGLKPSKIADLLGTNPNAVRVNKSIALRTIRAHVGQVSTEEILEKVRREVWRNDLRLVG